MTEILDQIFQMISYGRLKNSANSMAVVAGRVEDELRHGTRESMFALYEKLLTGMQDIWMSESFKPHTRDILQFSGDDLSNPVTAAYIYGQLTMAQVMLASVASKTISSEDAEYLAQPNVISVLKAVNIHDGVGGMTDDEIVRMLWETDGREVRSILAHLLEIGAIEQTRAIGCAPVNWLTPVARHVLVMADA